MKPVKRISLSLAAAVVALLCACSQPVPGPDKQGVGTVMGAATGAAAGAVTGFHVAAASGPGAMIGAGLGAVAGGVSGIVEDQQEEDLLALSARARKERSLARVHEILQEHYKRRVELHPTRDLYPADLFFDGDDTTLRPGADELLREIARLNRNRVPWSRLVVASYSRAANDDSTFAKYLAEHRAKAVGNSLVRAGLEPRRVQTRGVVVDAPVLLDPDDAPERYNQAIEIIPLDR